MRHDDNFAHLSAEGLFHARRGELFVRFCFGAAAGALAGAMGLVLAPRLAGVFLAFPAILPATLTLIEREDSERAAEDDDVGAVLGAAALVAFGALAWWLLPRLGAPAALAAATGGWLGCAVSLYVVLRRVAPRQERSSSRAHTAASTSRRSRARSRPRSATSPRSKRSSTRGST